MATIRIDDETHDAAKRLSEQLDVSIQSIMSRAFREFEENDFFRRCNAYYAHRTPEERAEDEAEMALWDTTLLDGLEDEPPYDDPRIAAAVSK